MADEPEASDTSPPAPPKASESMPITPQGDTGYDSAGVPTFEFVREKIETRYATAQGAAELDAESPEGGSVEKQYEDRQSAAAEKLAQIRESMRPDKGSR